MHDWKWDLETGKCLTTTGHPIRASRVIKTGSRSEEEREPAAARG